MLLEYEQIRSFTFGAIDTVATPCGVRFVRMTDKMKEAFAPYGVIKCEATAGMHLDFTTDSSFLRFSYADLAPASSRNFGLFDVLIDGVLCHTFGEDPISEGKGTAEISLPEGSHRVTVVFPNLASFTLSALELEDDCRAERAKKACRMLALGDSITQGYDARHPSLSYVNLVAEHFRAETWNCAVGGARFSADTLDESVPYVPDIVTVAYGTNDWGGCRAEELEQNSRAYFKKLVELYPKARIFAVLPIWRADMGEERLMGGFDRCYEILGKVLRQFKQVTPIGGMKLVPHMPEFFSDRFLHPDDMGFLFYGRNLIREMEKRLGAK